MLLIKELVKIGKLSETKAAELKRKLATSKRKEEELILAEKVVPESFLFELKSKKLDIPLREVYPEDVSLKLLELIPEDSSKFYSMIPIKKRDSILEVGMVYPEDVKAKEALKFWDRQSNFSYEIYLVTLSNFNKLLRQYRGLKKEVVEALGELEVKKKEIKEGEIKKMAEKAPISKIVAVTLRHAVDGGASDIHIEPFKDKLRIRYRALGRLFSSLTLPAAVHSAVVARIKILSNLKIDETRIPQDGRFGLRMAGRRIDFRISTFPTSEGEKIAIRILDPEKGLKPFAGLGLTGTNLEAIRSSINKPYGMILSTGPTGSGKTTTLYTILKQLNNEDVNIMTLEDPIEYYMEGINQSQVRPDIGYTFAKGLRHIMRQDPDIIMIGEIRDEETASLAIHSALTGHLVLSTLHTNNSLGVIPRLVNMGVEPFLLPSTLNIAVAQRLVRELCPACKEKTKAVPQVKNFILKEIRSMPESVRSKIKALSSLYIYKHKGCKKCNQTGFVSRIGIFETLNMTTELSELVLKSFSEADILKEAKRQGQITMRQDGVLKILDGKTTLEEVLRVTK